MLKTLKKIIPATLKRTIKRAITTAWESLLYGFARQRRLCPGDLKHIIFVCKGNICRSAFAEKYMRSRPNWRMTTIESCGLDVDQGGNSPLEAVRIAREFAVELDHHHSKGIDGCNFREADLIVAMEYRQYRRLIGIFPELAPSICVIRDFVPWPERLLCNIHDPYGLGESSFRRCFSQIANAIDSLDKSVTRRSA